MEVFFKSNIFLGGGGGGGGGGAFLHIILFAAINGKAGESILRVVWLGFS